MKVHSPRCLAGDHLLQGLGCAKNLSAMASLQSHLPSMFPINDARVAGSEAQMLKAAKHDFLQRINDHGEITSPLELVDGKFRFFLRSQFVRMVPQAGSRAGLLQCWGGQSQHSHILKTFALSQVLFQVGGALVRLRDEKRTFFQILVQGQL